ncbi:hypothetical protein QCN29_14930 [Streptomyces sp. HNM0663]|uniref:Uncharacterized protein n=1 Tax=Streptomyces chengmaiensis TaxID=3040919 RepID=A0ABT6HP63_9ACTN|nr:hypothetical protein [Streptomyces chengmaiensis]MDH2390062.1 hypothetical protein [Streptomyces chengmaiensis]
MLATPERVRKDGGQNEIPVWHRPVGRIVEEFQPITCSDSDGIVFPAPKQDVPLDLDRPGERWCTDCITLIRDARKRRSS